MQQRIRRLAVFFGISSLASLGLIMAACGTDNGTPVPTPQIESGKADTGGGKETGTNPTDDGGTEVDGGDSGVDCTSNPVLRDNSAGFRCAFKDGSAPDASAICAVGETCCNTESKATGPGYCVAAKTGDVGCAAAQPPGSTYNVGKGKAWECADNTGCTGAQICCMITDPNAAATDKVNIGKTLASDTKHPPACNAARVFKEGGSRCKTKNGDGNCPDMKDIKLCSLTDQNCGATATCTPFVDFTNFIDRGYCKNN